MARPQVIKIPRKPEDWSGQYFETDKYGRPIHANDIPTHVRVHAGGVDLATNSPIVLACIQRLVRDGEFSPTAFHIMAWDGAEYVRIKMDMFGDFITPWPECEDTEGIIFSVRYGERYPE